MVAEVASAEERIEGDTAKLVRNSKETYTLKKSGSAWKVAIRGEGREPTAADLSWTRTVIKSYRELAEKTERGQYKSEEELAADEAKVFDAAATAAQGSPSPAAAQQQQTALPDSSTPKKAALAFINALQSNNMKVARELAIGSDEELTDWKQESDQDLAIDRTNAATAKRFGAEIVSGNPDRNWNTRFESATEKINGDQAELVDGNDELAQLRKTDGRWKVELSGDNVVEHSLVRGFYGWRHSMSATAGRIAAINGVTANIEQGRYATAHEAFEGGMAKVDAARDEIQQSSTTKSQAAPMGQLATNIAKDPTSWANTYRNAKFITRAEFLKRVGPVHLVVRQRGVIEFVPNLEDIVRTLAANHRLTIASQPTDVQLVVDVELIRSKIVEYKGEQETGEYDMAYMARADVGFFSLKANCRRGEKFVQLDVQPCRRSSQYYGYMGQWVDFNVTYAKAMRSAVDGAFDAIAELTDSDDSDDMAAWNDSVWPAPKNAEMHNNFLSTVKGDPGAVNRTFYGVTEFDVSLLVLDADAAKELDQSSIRQSWTSELTRNGLKEIGTAVPTEHWVDADHVSRPFGGPLCYYDRSAVLVLERNVVFEFNGELRRADVCIWQDHDLAIALPKEHNNTLRELVDRSIRSAAKEFSLNR